LAPNVEDLVAIPLFESLGKSELEQHGADGELEAVTLRDGERIPLSSLFLFLGAAPHTDWLGGTVALDDDGFVLTGEAGHDVFSLSG